MKAINISLLLPVEDNEEVVRLQNILKDSDTSEFSGYQFFKLPHITLCHLYASDEEVTEICRYIEEIVTKVGSIHLVNVGINQGKLNHISIEKNVQLMVLYRGINNLVRSYLGRKGKSEYFFGTDICSSTIERVDGYSHENCSLHITLGPGNLDASIDRREYTASGIAVGHLGKYCTIGEVLKNFDL